MPSPVKKPRSKAIAAAKRLNKVPWIDYDCPKELKDIRTIVDEFLRLHLPERTLTHAD